MTTTRRRRQCDVENACTLQLLQQAGRQAGRKHSYRQQQQGRWLMVMNHHDHHALSRSGQS